MSYDIRLEKDGEPVYLSHEHHEQGGTFCVGGTNEAWLNITYNYAPHFFRVLGKKGIRLIYGLTAAKSIPFLKEAISKLGEDCDPDYWKATEGNARRSLEALCRIAELAPPDSKWSGD